MSGRVLHLLFDLREVGLLQQEVELRHRARQIIFVQHLLEIVDAFLNGFFAPGFRVPRQCFVVSV